MKYVQRHMLRHVSLSQRVSSRRVRGLVKRRTSQLVRRRPVSVQRHLVLRTEMFGSLEGLSTLRRLLSSPRVSRVVMGKPGRVFCRGTKEIRT